MTKSLSVLNIIALSAWTPAAFIAPKALSRAPAVQQGGVGGNLTQVDVCLLRCGGRLCPTWGRGVADAFWLVETMSLIPLTFGAALGCLKSTKSGLVY